MSAYGIDVAGLIVLLTLAAVLAVSGVAKLQDKQSTESVFILLRVPLVPRRTAARALPWAELVLAAALLLSPAPSLVVVAVLVLLLMLAYTVLIGRALTFDEPVTCGCFGRIGNHAVTRATLLRNVLLVALAAGALAYALDGSSAWSAVRDSDLATWLAVGAALAAAAVAVLITGGGTTPAPAVPAAVDEDKLLDYVRQPIPYGRLDRPDGSTATLRELASEQAQLVFVLTTGCGSCVMTAERVDGWADQLDPIVGVVTVYPEGTDVASTKHRDEYVAFEPELNVRSVLSVDNPAAVLLGADGLLAGGPVMGFDQITGFVEDVLEQLAEVPTPGPDADPQEAIA